jgi:hypothetical protein
MTIDEAKAAKAALESAISELLRRFSADTGTTVTRVEVDAMFRMAESPTKYVVQVDVQL